MALTLVIVALAALLLGGVAIAVGDKSRATNDTQVRAACVDHRGVNAVSGNFARKYVACRDGYFKTVR
jgi:hypothetical protein